jgi:1-acyl-sn-glycerol-3-phosphate acyltransferase
VNPGSRDAASAGAAAHRDPQVPPVPPSLIRSVWGNVVLVFLTVALAPPVILLAPLRRGEISMAIGRWGGRLHCRAAGVRITARGVERIPQGRPCVFVSNHQGTFDAHAMMFTVPPPVRVLAKKELFKVPFFGWGLSALGFPKVDRHNSPAARLQMEETARFVAARNIHIYGFPEGTRNTGRGLLPFKKGLFVLAIQLGMPIVPLVIRGSRAVQCRKTLWIRPGEISLEILDPVSTEGLSYEGRDRLIEDVRGVIEAHLAPEDRLE